MKTCISLNMLRELSSNGKTVCLPENSILSPSAKDFAREKGLVVFIDGLKDPVIGVSTGVNGVPVVETPSQCCAGTQTENNISVQNRAVGFMDRSLGNGSRLIGSL